MANLLTFCLVAFAGQIVRGADLELLSSADSVFSQRLYQQVALDKSNVVYSPFSIHSALTMTSFGARGETASEFSQTLLVANISNPHKTYHDLIEQMNSVKNVKLNTANGIFVNPRMPVEPAFIEELTKNYFASTFNFDLAAPEGPEKAINDFISQKTEGQIHDVLASGSIDGDTIMILVNTIFFNASWALQFEKEQTRKENFLQLGGAKSQVDMMYDERTVNIKRNVNGADVAELPLKGGRFSLYVALPKQADGITALENVLTQPGKVDAFFEGFALVFVKLSIPKFKIETTLDLIAALQTLGIKKAFSPSAADFSGISSAGNVYINKVIHKAMIEVTEKGTVAAAATVIIGGIESVRPAPNQEFTADHPFLFFLRDNQTKEILFQGKFSG